MDYKDIILKKYLKDIPSDIKVDERLMPYLRGVLDEYGRNVVKESMKVESNARYRVVAMIFGQFTKSSWEEFMLYLRAKSLKRYKRIAQRLADENRRKYYVIRSSNIGYKMFSSLDVKINKKLRIFGKDVSVLTLHETADAVIYPK